APLGRSSAAECPDANDLLTGFGVPGDAIVIAGASRTTRENALETARLLPAGARNLLVTSARHMPRSLRVFEPAGLAVPPARTDHVFRPDRPFAITALLPSPGALATSTSVWHEWLGGLWYAVSSASPPVRGSCRAIACQAGYAAVARGSVVMDCRLHR